MKVNPQHFRSLFPSVPITVSQVALDAIFAEICDFSLSISFCTTITVVLGTSPAGYPTPPEDFGVWTKVYFGSCSRS